MVNLAKDKIQQFQESYNEMGGGTMSITHSLHKENFEVKLTHIPTGRVYEFTFTNDTPFKEMVEELQEILAFEMRAAGWKGMAS